MNICFDLDGPIIDVSDRYYRAYIESLKEGEPDPKKILNKEEFWYLKQNRITDFELSIMSGLSVKEAKKSADKRRALSHKTEYLTLDKLFDDVYDVLNYLRSKNINFFIVTLRRKSQLQFAVKQFKLNKYFSEGQLFSLEDEKEFLGDIPEKYSSMFEAIKTLIIDPMDTWIIGDSETDIHAGRLAKYGKVISISRGVRSKSQLETLKPDIVIDNLKEVLKLIRA